MATLNYERLLEISLLAAGVAPVVGLSASHGQVEVVLPHGCCHLFCEGVRASAAGVSFSGVGVAFDGQVIAVGDPNVFWDRINNDAVPPVMSYFEPKKTTSAGTSFIQQQRERWAEVAEEAKLLAIVGVKVRPDDDHIWGPIAESRAKLVYCAGPAAAGEFKAWAANARPRRRDLVFPDYFDNAFLKLTATLGL